MEEEDIISPHQRRKGSDSDIEPLTPRPILQIKTEDL